MLLNFKLEELIMSKEINLLGSEFVSFTEERLMKRITILNDIIADPDALDEEIAGAAMKRKEVKELLSVFAMVKQVGMDPSGMSAYDVLDIVIQASTGKTADQVAKQTSGGALAQSLGERTAKAIDTTKKVTKKGAGGLGSWLTKWAYGDIK
jgi:hypothetical protein